MPATFEFLQPESQRARQNKDSALQKLTSRMERTWRQEGQPVRTSPVKVFGCVAGPSGQPKIVHREPALSKGE